MSASKIQVNLEHNDAIKFANQLNSFCEVLITQMNKQMSQASKQLLNLVESENQLPEAKGYSTIKQLNELSRENNDPKLEKDYDSLVDLAKTPKLKREQTQKGEKKVAVAKKPKVISIEFNEFLPQFLILLNQQKHKSIIRVGKNYQANVPRKCSFAYLYRPLGHLKVWDGGQIQSSIFKKFREKFGENRSEQDLCMLLYQYQCEWGELNDHINEFKGELRKCYLQRDRTKL